jgi:reverse gyrase
VEALPSAVSPESVKQALKHKLKNHIHVYESLMSRYLNSQVSKAHFQAEIRDLLEPFNAMSLHNQLLMAILARALCVFSFGFSNILIHGC